MVEFAPNASAQPPIPGKISGARKALLAVVIEAFP